MRGHTISICFLLVVSWTAAFSQKHTVSGYIYEKGSKESLIGATIYFPELKAGTLTNNYGFYSITLPASKDSLLMTVSYIGYTPIIQTLLLNQNYSLNLDMDPTIELKEVVIDGRKINIAQETQMSMIEIPIQQLKNIPALMGEKDVIKALQLLPGVQKGTEGSAGLYVRGGGPDQNLIILDDATVYNANHLFGFFSTFNGDAIKNVQLIKGGFPARYGGRLSSVVDLTMKDGNQEKVSGEAGIGLIASRMTVEGPIEKNKSSFLVSARRTYLDVLTVPIVKIYEPNLTTGYYFYDLNAKFNYKLDDKNRLYVSGYLGRDKFYFRYNTFEFLDKAGLFWGNITGTTRWNHQFNNVLFGNASLIISDYTFNVYNTLRDKGEDEEFNLDYKTGIRDYTTKYDLDFRPSPAHMIRTGALFTYHVFTPSALVTKNTFEGINSRKIKELGSIEGGFYIEDEIKASARLNLSLGLRYSLFKPENEIYQGLEPRFGSRYFLTENLAIKGSYAMMNQYLHLLSNSGAGLPTDLWVPATDRVRPQQSQQVALGLAREFEDKGIEVTLEGYYKHMDNIITYKEGASFFLIDPLAYDEGEGDSVRYEDNVTSGTGKSYGTELFVKYDKGNFNGWIGYTLSWTIHQFDEVNGGKPYYPKYDRRHDISIVGSYKFNERTRLSATWVYGTGNSLTLEQATFPATSFDASSNYYYYQEATSYGEKNGFRMEAYHRMDIGLQRSKKVKWGERTWEYSLYNAYGHANPFFYMIGPEDMFEYGYGDSKNVLYKVALFPVVPSVSYTLKF